MERTNADRREMESLKKLCMKSLYDSYLERPSLSRNSLVQMPTTLLIEFDSFTYVQLWDDFSDSSRFDVMNASEEIVSQRRCLIKSHNLQQIAAGNIIRLCSYLNTSDIYTYLRNVPIENLIFIRRLFHGRNWRYVIQSIIRQIIYARIFGE